MDATVTVNLAPVLRLLMLVAAIALVPLALWWWRHRHDGLLAQLRALTLLVAILTFDLIVFGAFTRLTDSGLGCPDWPGCYGHASPVGAAAPIEQAQAAQPSGPVTSTKAWIEMVHRYLAMTLGALIIVTLGLSWRARRLLPHSLAWPAMTLVWVIVQGLFGKYTVTLKLYPLVVTLHLLGGLVLLALLVRQYETFRVAPLPVSRRAVTALLVLVFIQVALGGWVSSNYAVLACDGFPTCNGAWWPAAMDWSQGFTLLRPLGGDGDGGFLTFTALVAIHWVHRLAAVVVVGAGVVLAWRLRRTRAAPGHARGLGGLLALQVLSGASNVVLEWPLLAALLHSAGAAALVALLISLHARAAGAPRAA